MAHRNSLSPRVALGGSHPRRIRPPIRVTPNADRFQGRCRRGSRHPRGSRPAGSWLHPGYILATSWLEPHSNLAWASQIWRGGGEELAWI